MIRDRPNTALNFCQCSSCQVKSEHLTFRRNLVLRQSMLFTNLTKFWTDDVERSCLLH